MTITASPHPRRSLLRAVIEDARRRARRRRERYAACLMLLACAGATAYLSLDSGGGPPVVRTLERIDVAVRPSPVKNGDLTIMDVEANAQHEGPDGWYGLSTVDARGRLHTLVRCPRHVGWCGQIESIDWAPGGKRLAFGVTSFGARNPYNGLHIANLRTGRDGQLLRSGAHGEHDWGDIDWSPDGNRLAYVSSGAIMLINADGTGRTVLHTGTTGHDHQPTWSPDGRWIAFSTRHDGELSVYAIRVDGLGRRLLAQHGAAPAWSPDGARIAFRGAGGIEFVSPDGNLLAPRPGLRPGDAVGIDGEPVWSPDGKKLAISSTRYGTSSSGYGTYVMNADGSNLTRLTRHVVGVLIGQARPAWRPVP